MHGILPGVERELLVARRREVDVETVARGPYLYINPPASGRFTIEAELGEEKLTMTRDLVGRRYLHLLFEFGRAKKE